MHLPGRLLGGRGGGPGTDDCPRDGVVGVDEREGNEAEVSEESSHANDEAKDSHGVWEESTIQLQNKNASRNDGAKTHPNSNPTRKLVDKLPHRPRRRLGLALLGRMGANGSVQRLQKGEDKRNEADNGVGVDEVTRERRVDKGDAARDADERKQPTDDLNDAVCLEPSTLRSPYHILCASSNRGSPRPAPPSSNRHKGDVGPHGRVRPGNRLDP
mmetsp:Transcript_35772/g.90191  ORF Transcript_35772/g.90191 Transcript_35772/m.90191 type:complete len:215 (+) Transcript_35772:236-880(+)